MTVRIVEHKILQDMPTSGLHDGFQDAINLQIGVLLGKCLYFLALGKQSVDVFPLDILNVSVLPSAPLSSLTWLVLVS